MTPEQLLQECELLTHRERMYRMVGLGRLIASDASVNKTIMTLMQGSVYERGLAVQCGFGSRNATLALQGLTDPSRSIRAQALDLVALLGDDAELQIALDSIPLDMQMTLLHALDRTHKQAPIDTYIETLAARGDQTLKKLLPLASLEVVKRH